jgi:purine-binding chemotaxis protein CheW
MSETADQNLREYVTAVIGGQLFGLPILRVQDVFAPERLTTVPLAPAEIAGVLNLRGRIVTLINMRRRLGLGDQEGGGLPMAVGVESRGESYGLLIDSVGEVLKLDDTACESNPSNLDPRLASVSTGIHRLDGQLLMVLDVDRVLDIVVKTAAA